MTDEIEMSLKVQNWLSVFTFDAYKLDKAGGDIIVRQTSEGLTFILPGVDVDTEGVNKRIKKLVVDEKPTP